MLHLESTLNNGWYPGSTGELLAIITVERRSPWNQKRKLCLAFEQRENNEKIRLEIVPGKFLDLLMFSYLM